MQQANNAFPYNREHEVDHWPRRNRRSSRTGSSATPGAEPCRGLPTFVAARSAAIPYGAGCRRRAARCLSDHGSPEGTCYLRAIAMPAARRVLTLELAEDSIPRVNEGTFLPVLLAHLPHLWPRAVSVLGVGTVILHWHPACRECSPCPRRVIC
jgi:hypothetical protein